MASASAAELLGAAVDILGYTGSASFVRAVDSPNNLPREIWSGFGEWLTQGHEAGVDHIFFVKGNPVVVFSRVETLNPTEIRKRLDRIWCMARPSLLFLASDGELRIFNLTDRPAAHFETLDDDARLLETVRSVREVQTKLLQYRRTEVESGAVFEDAKFDQRYRADYSLIRDLTTVRKRLLASIGKPEVVNRLISKAIFIRYLEDRGIIDHAYYTEVAKDNASWLGILEAPYAQPSLPHRSKAILPKVLKDRDFALAVFDRLDSHFNGDIFHTSEEEHATIASEHLLELSSLLLGEADGSSLFFRIYQFDVIPIELISCIYEEFYNNDLAEAGSDDQHGTHYTPTSLVEFLLSSTLRDTPLVVDITVVDPACGSGIFLVAAFRRIVRERWAASGVRPDSAELVEILGGQICGIDINEPAVVIASFSLYLALLHYQRPKAIIDQMSRGHALPNLVARGSKKDRRHLNILHVGDAFEVAALKQTKVAIPAHSFDVVIGNPPWGIKGTTDATRVWIGKSGRSMSRGERSQAFTWLALHLLKPGGQAGLLLAKSILLSHDKPNTAFRQQLIKYSTLLEVADFSHVRQIFFSGPDRQAKAIHPFISIVFRAEQAHENRFTYLSAKRSPLTERLQAPVFSYNDVHRLNQDDQCADYRFWKSYWWGSHRDYQLISRLDAEDRLADHVPSTASVDRGFQLGRSYPKSSALRKFPVLNKKHLGRYGTLRQDVLDQANSTINARLGNLELYSGSRLILSRSPRQDSRAYGRLIARFEKRKFCFSDDVLGIQLSKEDDRSYLIVLGILWSSLARYYLWFTTSMWGTRNDKIHKGELLNLPIRFPAPGAPVERKLLKIVRELRRVPFDSPKSLFDKSVDPTVAIRRMKSLERSLDRLVFDLFDFSPADCDLVKDLCTKGLPFFYDGWKSNAARPVVTPETSPPASFVADVNDADVKTFPILDYVRVFAEQWNRALLGKDGELAYSVIQSPTDSGMLAVMFRSQPRRTSLSQLLNGKTQAWAEELDGLAEVNVQPLGPGNMYVDGLVRIISHSSIVIIKRNERRLWTRSLARVDGEATWLKAMK